MNIILIYFAIKYKGNWDKIYEALEAKEKVSLKDLKNLETKIDKKEFSVITILDIDYPDKLKKAYKPPFVIFYKGDKKILGSTFTYASGNSSNSNTIQKIQDIVPKILENKGLITSLYKGVDEAVYKIAIKHKAKTMFIAANGLNDVYKASNMTMSPNTLLISEYPYGVHVSKDRLRARNRLGASFAEQLILFSSQKANGIMNLVTHFLNMGKEIYCFPGSGDENDGNSELIKQGANLITNAEDLKNK